MVTIRFGLEDSISLQPIVNARRDKFKCTLVDHLDEKHCSVITHNSDDLIAVCDLMADIIMENLQIRFIVHMLRLVCPDVPDKLQSKILIGTLKALWYNKPNDIQLSKLDISVRLQKFILEVGPVYFTLESFMKFRMKDYLTKWIDMMSDCIVAMVGEPK